MEKKQQILLAGQSNMAGRDVASPEDLEPIENVEVFRHGKWYPAIEPVTRDRSMVGCFSAADERMSSPDPWDNPIPGEGMTVRGVGPGRTFAKLFHKRFPNRPIGLIPTAIGGTPVAAWLPGGVDPWDAGNHPYDDAVRAAREAMKYGEIVCVLWHQGETDAHRGTRSYKEDLCTVIANFRRDLNLNGVPFLLGELGDFYEENIQKNVPGINGIMHELSEELELVRVASSAGLVHRGDRLHFNARSARELGRRYFELFESVTH